MKEYVLYSVTYNDELGSGTKKEMQEMMKVEKQCNKDFGNVEVLRIEEREYN